ncbi:hypothetical protein OB236_19980 [Paenibacillus sp. WQ 127069]|uniref:ABC transporter substrate-binding protein n=1 Tax=Paenibacillus baimaensis TaxID=2982185 RepID=A0ABT2UIA8_9BACL|nr:MqnA/MqnD/SBP family protein [Paenibacillus sp. WQ 127069]MCU6794389.1 hypothetical protein [Paenibacillus sp. WQ 127069]
MLRRRTLHLLLLTLTGLIILLGGCSRSAEDVKETTVPSTNVENVVLLSPKAPSLIPALLAEKKGSPDMKLKVETWDTIEQLLARIQNGNVPFVAAPLNLGANIAAKGLPLQLLHVNTWGSMYLISTSPDAHRLADLTNETVYIPGQSGPPDIVTRFLLRKEGLDGKIKLAYSTVPEMMQQLAAGTIKYAVLPEPMISGLRVKLDGRLYEVIDFQKAWRAQFGEDLPQTGIFVNREWAKTHTKEVAQFQIMYRDALNETVLRPEESLKLSAEAFGLPQAVLSAAMTKISLVYKDARDAKPEVERYFQILLQDAPESIGGRLPDAGFYYGL